MALVVDIQKTLGRFHLAVSFQAEGEIMALLGSSGCGKSMTLKSIAGIVTPDEGHIALDGRVLYDSAKHINLPPQRRRVGYLFQHYALFPNMTVAQNIAAGIRDRARRKSLVAEKVSALSLNGLEDKYPCQLSGGQQQRVALARILANEPALLLLDEPLSALDSYLKWQVELELMDTLASFGGTALFVSHSRDEVYRLCDSVCVLNAGRSERKLPVRALFDSPGTLSSCLLSGCKNVSRARPAGDRRVEALDWGVVLTAARPVPGGITHVGIRAHYVAPAGDGAENTFSCTVERVVDDVFSTVVMLATPGGGAGFSRLRMELPKEAWRALGAPAVLPVRLRPEDLLLLTDG